MSVNNLPILLANYGVLGAWTLWLLYQQNDYKNDMKIIIQNNTKAMAEFKYISSECKYKNQ